MTSRQEYKDRFWGGSPSQRRNSHESPVGGWGPGWGVQEPHRRGQQGLLHRNVALGFQISWFFKRNYGSGLGVASSGSKWRVKLPHLAPHHSLGHPQGHPREPPTSTWGSRRPELMGVQSF